MFTYPYKGVCYENLGIMRKNKRKNTQQDRHRTRVPHTRFLPLPLFYFADSLLRALCALDDDDMSARGLSKHGGEEGMCGLADEGAWVSMILCCANFVLVGPVGPFRHISDSALSLRALLTSLYPHPA